MTAAGCARCRWLARTKRKKLHNDVMGIGCQ